MNLLHSNDRLGQYPASWYADTADPLPQFPRLKGDTSADIAVIGGGFTGLSTALHAWCSVLDAARLRAWLGAALAPPDFPRPGAKAAAKAKFAEELPPSVADAKLFKKLLKAFCGGKKKGEGGG